MQMTGRRILRGALAAMIVASVAGVPAVAAAKELSDRSVKVLMEYAWAVLPSKFTTQKGDVIEVDKKKDKKAVLVPIELGREVIAVARLSAHAQVCKLPTEQAANYQTMMRQQEATKQWTPQQLLYISQIHLFTVMWLTGNVKLVEKDGEKEVVMEEGQSSAEQTCTDEERKQVTEAIISYVCKEKMIKLEGCPAG